MRPVFPTSEYYDGSATPRAHQQTARLARPPSRPGAHGALPTFTVIRLTGSASGFTPATHPQSTRSIPTATTPDSPDAEQDHQVKERSRCCQTAHPPDRRPLPDKGASTTSSLALCLSVSLARTPSSGSTAAPLRRRGALAAGARFHATTAPSFSRPLHRPRTGITAGTESSLPPAKPLLSSQRLVAHFAIKVTPRTSYPAHSMQAEPTAQAARVRGASPRTRPGRRRPRDGEPTHP